MIKQSAGVLLLREDWGEFHLLALAGRNSWDLPKGGVENNESTFEAAKRELEEEAGITKVTWLIEEPFEVEYSVNNKKKRVYLYLGLTKKKDVKISKEHQSYRWFSLDEANEFLPDRFLPAVAWIQKILQIKD